MSNTKPLLVRVAMRVQGDYWVACFAPADTLEGAREVGRVHMSIVQDRSRKDAFLNIFSTFVADVVEAGMGVRPDIDCRQAPEHERSGRA